MTLDIPNLADLCEDHGINIQILSRMIKGYAHNPDRHSMFITAENLRENAERILKYASDLEKIANEKQ